MRHYDVHNFIFSSSATVYGVPKRVPLYESDPIGSATNPYGETKIMIERILEDVAKADPSLNVALLRYFNPIGGHPSGLLGEDPNGIPNNLMPYITQVAIGKLPFLKSMAMTIRRSMARAFGITSTLWIWLKAMLPRLRNSKRNLASRSITLGTGKGTSVLELVHAFEKANGVKIPYQIEPRRAGDVGCQLRQLR
jgi:UDP-glucose 4-epimerase